MISSPLMILLFPTLFSSVILRIFYVQVIEEVTLRTGLINQMSLSFSESLIVIARRMNKPMFPARYA